MEKGSWAVAVTLFSLLSDGGRAVTNAAAWTSRHDGLHP